MAEATVASALPEALAAEILDREMAAVVPALPARATAAHLAEQAEPTAAEAVVLAQLAVQVQKLAVQVHLIPYLAHLLFTLPEAAAVLSLVVPVALVAMVVADKAAEAREGPEEMAQLIQEVVAEVK